MKKRLPSILLIGTVVLAVIGFSDFGESMYWSLARPFSAVLFILWLTHRLMAAESAQYDQDDYARAFAGAQKKKNGRQRSRKNRHNASLAAASSH
jgi:hypothetical protein